MSEFTLSQRIKWGKEEGAYLAVQAAMEDLARKLRAAVHWSYDYTNGSSEADKARNDAMTEIANAIDSAFNVDSQKKPDAEPDHSY